MMRKIGRLALPLLVIGGLLTACSGPIHTDHSTWVTAITAASRADTQGNGETAHQTQETDASVGTTTTKTTVTAPAHVGPAEIAVGYCNEKTGLNVRPEPNTSCTPIGGLVYGDKVTILGKSGSWYWISFGDTQAYVYAKYISPDPVN